MTVSDSTPILAAIGEISDRPLNPANALEPAALMAEALRRAEADAGIELLKKLDEVHLIGLVSWRYANPVASVCEQLGIQPHRMANTSMGGETPVRLIHEAALAVQRGSAKAVAVIGGEAVNARGKAKAAGIELDWTPQSPKEETCRFANDRIIAKPLAQDLGLRDPASMYPLYEVALQAAQQQSPEEGRTENAELWARYAAVAASNPNAWIKQAPAAASIAETGESNRMICWPYPKLMVANPSVNQAAALVVTSVRFAREQGIPEKNWIYLQGGAAANEPDDFLDRDSFVQSSAQNATLDAALKLAGGDIDSIDFLELYSCFPVVPKMAYRQLKTTPDQLAPTVAGGLTFFGGPLNNYMSHAACAMVRALRNTPASKGLLYGQGGFVTKHHALVLSQQPVSGKLEENFSVQAEADAQRGPVPPFNPDYQGTAHIETYTVFYNREGEAAQAAMVLRGESNVRCLARVRKGDAALLTRLTNPESSAVGLTGKIEKDNDDLPVFVADNVGA